MFFEFNFDEPGLGRELAALDTLVSTLSSRGVAVTVDRPLPPCIETSPPPSPGPGVTWLGERHAVLGHDLFYAPHLRGPNELLRPFTDVAARCLACSHYRDLSCRGIPGAKFAATRARLMESLGARGYRAVVRDFRSSSIVTGSFCKNRCRFCYDKCLAPDIVYRAPLLGPEEIGHFAYYLGSTAGLLGVTRYCANGEVADHPAFEQIIDALHPLIGSIYTNGLHLDAGSIDLIGAYGLAMIVSVHSVRDATRAGWMGYRSAVPIKETLARIDRTGIDYTAVIVVLRSNLDSGDLEETVEYLDRNTRAGRLILQRLIVSPYLRATEHGAMLAEQVVEPDEIELPALERIEIVRDDRFVYNRTAHRRPQYLAELSRRITRASGERNDARGVVLAPRCSALSFVDLDPANADRVEVESSFEFAYPNADLVSFDQCLEAMKGRAGNHGFIVMPRQGLSESYRDLRQESINDFLAQSGKPVALLG
jgi:hypothetical protein